VRPSAILEFHEGAQPARGRFPRLASAEARTSARSDAIARLKDDFQRVAAVVRADLESKTARGGEKRESQRGAVQVAWLIRSVRAPLSPLAIADVAAHEEVRKVDVPHRLTAEIDETCAVVGAPGYRQRHQRSGKGVVVAIIDTEAHLDHAALSGRLIHKQNYSAEPLGRPGEHGTAVAGIAGATDATFLGVAPEVTLYNYKVLATDDERFNGDDFDGALAIQQALEDGARVANCSWGAGPATDGSSRECLACDTAWGLGMTIVKSAGNRGPDRGTLTTPADAEGVIVVGATSRDGKTVADYSSRGPTADGRVRPHLVAPGGGDNGGIRSCLLDGAFGDCGSGTSFAAPHVTGLVALLLENDPSLTPDALRAELVAHCQPLPGVPPEAQGAGVVVL
jgi:serine protease AprX